MGQHNFIDVLRLQNLVNGMQVRGKVEVCIQEKCVETPNTNPDARAEINLHSVHIDLAGPITNESIDSYNC